VISTSALHAIRALVFLARQPRGAFAGTGSVADAIDAPPNYLGKLLQALARANLVSSRKGLRGGFRLERDPAEISLLEIAEPIEQVSRWEGCFLGGGECSDDAPCAVHAKWGALRDAYLSLLSETTIADLIKREPAGDSVMRPSKESPRGRHPSSSHGPAQSTRRR
jgi:Rrf2 family protein